MKVLVVLPSQGVYGGMEVFALTLAESLLRGGRHQVKVCFKLVTGHEVQQDLAISCANQHVETIFCGRGSRTLFEAMCWADLVHAQNCSPDIGLFAKMLRRPLVVTVHNWRRTRISPLFSSWRWVHDHADYRTYNSAFVMRSWHRPRLASRSQVIPAVAEFGGIPRPTEQRRGFFFIGRWIEGKGLHNLISAYQQADLDKTLWPLRIAGSGPLRNSIDQLIAKGGSDGIMTLGFLSEPEKQAELAAAKWLVCPPHTLEDMGLTPIEARALGVPSIVTVDGGLPEAAGPYAVFVPPDNVPALARALELVSKMTECAYAERADGARASLRGYLQPLSVYEDIYHEVKGDLHKSTANQLV